MAVQTAPWNARAMRVAEKLGFVEGGSMRIEPVKLPDGSVLESAPVFVLPGMARVAEDAVFRKWGGGSEG